MNPVWKIIWQRAGRKLESRSSLESILKHWIPARHRVCGCGFSPPAWAFGTTFESKMTFAAWVIQAVRFQGGEQIINNDS